MKPNLKNQKDKDYQILKKKIREKLKKKDKQWNMKINILNNKKLMISIVLKKEKKFMVIGIIMILIKKFF